MFCCSTTVFWLTIPAEVSALSTLGVLALVLLVLSGVVVDGSADKVGVIAVGQEEDVAA